MTGATAECRGGAFRYVFEPAQTPTWWTFQDELVIRDKWWHIEPGDVVLDVGADLGSYTLSALAAGAAKVYAWSLHWQEVFAMNVAVNGWQDKVTLNGYGLWSRSGWLTSLPGISSLVFHAEATPSAFRVETMDDAAAFLKLTRADWLKIDVEGAEEEVLKGATRTITTMRPKILLELHMFKDKDIASKCRSVLASLGYKETGIEGVGAHVAHALYLPAE